MTQFVQGMPFLGPNPWDLDFYSPPSPLPQQAATKPQPDALGLRGPVIEDMVAPPLRGTTTPFDMPAPKPAPAPEPAAGSGKWLGGLILDALGVQKQSLPETTPKDPQGGTIVTRALEDFVFTPAYVGLNEAAKDFTQSSYAAWKDLKQYDETYGPRELPELAQPTTVAELQANPKLAGQKMMTTAFRFAPAAAGAIGGAVAVGPGAAAGAGAIGVAELLGMTAGASMATLGQVWGVNLDTAQKKYPNDPEKAYDEAVRATAVDTGFAAFGTLALGANPFGNALKDMALQTFVTQPAIGVAGSVAHQAETGDSAGLTLADEYLNVMGPSVLMAGAGAVTPKLHGILTPEAAAEPWSLPWKKNGEAFEIDPEVASVIPEDAPRAPGEPHPAEAFGGALQRVQNPVDAWHGSPHDISEFKLTPDTLGTGEGNQAFGEGLYFGEARKVGEEYRKTIAEDRGGYVRRHLKAADGDADAAIKRAEAEIERLKALPDQGNDPQRQQSFIRTNMNLVKDLKAYKETGELPKGNLYNVDLHVEPHQVVDWDGALRDQPKAFQDMARAMLPKKVAPPLEVKRIIDEAVRTNDGGVTPESVALTISNDRKLYDAGWALIERTYGPDRARQMRESEADIGEYLAKEWAPYLEHKGFAGEPAMSFLNRMRREMGESKAAQMLRDNGIRALTYFDASSRSDRKGTKNYVMLHDEDIAIKAKFQRGHNKPPADEFYYKSERVLPTLAAKATGKQWDSTLRNKGVKAEELEDLGIAKFLKEAGDTPVTREQIQTLIDANRAEFQVKTFGDDPSLARREQAILDEMESLMERTDPEAVRRRAELAREEEAVSRERFEGDAAKYDTFVMPGGKNYREIVLSVDPGGSRERIAWLNLELGRIERKQHQWSAEIAATSDPAVAARNRPLLDQAERDWQAVWDKRRELQKNAYTSSHWPDTANPLAHMRLTDREGVDGTTSVHMEEGQSDWHNAGKKQGYKTLSQEEIKALDAEVAAALTEYKDTRARSNEMKGSLIEYRDNVLGRAKSVWRIYDRDDLSKVIWEGPESTPNAEVYAKAKELGAPMWNAERVVGVDPIEKQSIRELQEEVAAYERDVAEPALQRYSELYNRLEQATTADLGGVPDAPFKKSVTELTFKKLVRHAIENGYDRVTWNTGDQVAESQGLNRTLWSIDYGTNDGKTWMVNATSLDGYPLADISGQRFSAADLERYLGKDVAERIVKNEGEPLDDDAGYKTRGMLTGDGLRISPAGKRTTYDKVLVNAARAFEKLGGKYGKVKVNAGKQPFEFDGLPETSNEIADRVRAIPDYMQKPTMIRAEISAYKMAIEQGDDPATAAANNLSPEAGELLGGAILGKLPGRDVAEVHSLEITDKMKRAVMDEGIPYYQRAEAKADPYADGPYRERTVAKVSLSPEQLKKHARLLREVTDTIKTMAPHVKVLPVSNLVERGADGSRALHTGVFFPETQVGPLIVFALEGPYGFNTKVTGTARHEVIHALKAAGIIKPHEWQALVDAANKEDWKKKHRIDARYEEFGEPARLEEAIAEEMGASFGDNYALHSPLVRKVFQKLQTLMRRLKTSVQKVMGKDVRAREIMEMIESGAMGWRKPGRGDGGDPSFQRGYHGTQSEFSRFRDPSDDYMVDRALGTHFAEDPRVSNRFTLDDDTGKAVEGSRIIMADIPDKYLDVDQKQYDWAKGRTDLKPWQGIETDQTAVERMASVVAFKRDPKMLARFLEDSRRMEPAEAERAAQDLANGRKTQVGMDGEYDLEGFVRNFGGKPYNTADRRRLVELAREHWQSQGYDGLRYKNTAPMEMVDSDNPTSYIVFDRDKIKFQKADPRQDDLFTPDPTQVRAENFKKWFRKSAVAHDDGAPRVMYHWTAAKTDFDAFKRKLGDIGMHFGTKGQAGDRADFLKMMEAGRGKPIEGDRTIPVYLSIQKPLRVTDVGWFSYDNLRSDILGKVKDGELPGEWELALHNIEKAHRTPNGQLAALRDYLERRGYDGLVYANTGETDQAAPYRAETDQARLAHEADIKARGLDSRDGILAARATELPSYKAWMKAMDAEQKHRQENAADSYVAFRPEQIKSAIGNKGTFSPRQKSIMLQKAMEENDLVAIHNLSASNLAFADRRGGLAAPSVAIIKPKHGLDGYGEITLLAPKELVDPKAGAKVYGADIYSPRYPRITYRLNNKEMDAVFKRLKPVADELETSVSMDIQDVEDKGMRAFEEALIPMILYAREKGIPIGADNSDRISTRKNPHNGKTEPDYWGMKNDLRQKLSDDPDYSAWVQEKFGHTIKDERILKGFSNAGNRLMIDHTLENVVKIMSKRLRGGEDWNYGTGNVRAQIAPQFKSLAQVKREHGRLVDRPTFEKLREEVNGELFNLADSFKQYATNGLANDFRWTDSFSMHLQEIAAAGASPYAVKRVLRDYVDVDMVSDNDVRRVVDFLQKLRGLPTNYFEVKIPRAVQIGEFSAALVPDNVSPATIEILRKNGITDIRSYPRPNGLDTRGEHLPQFKNMMFQKAEPPSSPAFKNWFRQSKAVDGRGKPKLLWHGTESLFREFKADPHTATIDGKQRQFTTFYFTDKKAVAASYADEMELALGGDNGLMPVYLSLQNPKVLDWGGQNWWNRSPKRDISQAFEDGHDGVIIKNMRDESHGGGKSSTVYVAFDPKQIKSAHNEGTWRTDTADIYLQKAGVPPPAAPQSTVNALPRGGAAEDDEPETGGPGDTSDDNLYDRASEDWRKDRGIKLAGQANRERGIGPREAFEAETEMDLMGSSGDAEGAITMEDLLAVGTGGGNVRIPKPKISPREIRQALIAKGRKGIDPNTLSREMREIEERRRQLNYGVGGIERRGDADKKKAERRYKADTKNLKEPPPFDIWILDQLFPPAH